jgi:RND family efflux transporter MFP subunit
MSSRRSQKIVLLAGLAALGAVILVGNRFFREGSRDDAFLDADEIPEVRLANIEEIVLDGVIEAEILFEAETKSLIVAPDVARVTFLAPLGGRVARGGVIARLESTEQVRVSSPEARPTADPALEREIHRLEDRLRRLEELLDHGAVSRREVEETRQELARQRAASIPSQAPPRIEMRPVVRRHQLNAPIDGVVMERRAAIGEIVPMRAPLLVIGHPDSIRPILRIDSVLASRLAPGMPVTLIRDGLVMTASLARIVAIETDSSQKSMSRVILEAVGPVSAGDSTRMEARIATADRRRSLFAPAAAIETDSQGGRKAWIVRDGRARSIAIRTGFEDERRVEILEGLSPGDSLVLRPGRHRLVDDEPVRATRD